jgi:hypothetical protein
LYEDLNHILKVILFLLGYLLFLLWHLNFLEKIVEYVVFILNFWSKWMFDDYLLQLLDDLLRLGIGLSLNLLLFVLVLLNQAVSIALAAADRKFFSVRRMESIHWALFETFTGERLNILPVVMTRLTKVMSSKTEPSGSLAAVSAFEHDKVSAMLCAVCDTGIDTVLLAETTEEILRLRLLLKGRLFLYFLIALFDFLLYFLLLDTSGTVPHATVVWKFALEALIVGQFHEGEFFKLVVELSSFDSNTLILVKAFYLSTIDCPFFDHAEHSCTRLNNVIKICREIFVLLHFGIAGGALNEVEGDSLSGIPLNLDTLLEAVRVKDMFALKLNTRTVS